MQFKDYYQVLGVPESASADDIKKAFRRLARTFHPDINKSAGAEKRFTEINEANEVLSDLKKRAEYDTLRKGGLREGQEFPGTPPGFEGSRSTGGFPDVDAENYSEFFQSLFGHAKGPAAIGGREVRASRNAARICIT